VLSKKNHDFVNKKKNHEKEHFFFQVKEHDGEFGTPLWKDQQYLLDWMWVDIWSTINM